MKELYIANNFSLTGHDYSVSIIYENKIYSIEIAKLLGIKYFGGYIDYYNKNRLYGLVFNILDRFLKDFTDTNIYDLKINNINFFSDEKFDFNIVNHIIFDHHYLHACSTFYPSSFSEAAILVIDDYGVTENIKFESQSMWYGNGNIIKKLYSNIGNTKYELAGIGRAYSKYSDFIGMEEGSIMGLSSYGDKNTYKNIKLFKYDGDNVSFDEKIDLKLLYGLNESDFLDKENNLLKSKIVDITFHLQSEVEEAIVYLANRLYLKTRCKNLCLAGGVALNILANTKILENTNFENIFIQPATNDSGLSLGAVYHGYHVISGNKNRIVMNEVGLGNNYSDIEIEEELKKYNGKISYKKSNNISKDTAKLLVDSNVIGWFQGRNEYGPRALGNRSILADSRSLEIKDKVNDIKARQRWRPLAPVILEEEVGKYFKLGIKSPYMTFSSEVFENKKGEIPGVIHIDGTVRYQTVSKEFNGRYYDLLNSFYELTGTPVLINTSLNVRGQSIIEKPDDAIKLLLSTNLDFLIIGDYIVSKNILLEELKFDNKENNLILLKQNLSDKKIYIKKWNLIRKILLFNYDVIFTYGDSESPISYSTYKFSFLVNKKLHFIIELVNENSGYFKRINDIGIKFMYHDENKNIIKSVIEKQFIKNYYLLEKIIKGKKT